jgi:hypothetical protein
MDWLIRWGAKFLSSASLFLEGSTYFVRATVHLCLAFGLIWIIGLIFPYIAEAWGIPQKKPWEFLTAVTSNGVEGITHAVGTMTAEKPRTPTPTIIAPVIAAEQPTSTSAVAPPTPWPTPPPSASTVTPAPVLSWEQTQAILDTVWERDWPKAISLLSEFVRANPDHAAAKGKLYAALIAQGDLHLKNGDKGSAGANFSQAANLNSGDGAARARLLALTPTAIPPPTPVPPVPPTRTAAVKPTQPPATAAPPAVRAEPENTGWVVIANAGGQGVWIRSSPRVEDRMKEWPEGTRMEVTAPPFEQFGVIWIGVRAPDTFMGFVPYEYTRPAPRPAVRP